MSEPIGELETLKRCQEALEAMADHSIFNKDGYWTEALEGFHRLFQVPWLRQELKTVEQHWQEAEEELRAVKDAKREDDNERKHTEDK